MFKSSLVSAFSRALGEKEERAQQPDGADYDFTGRRVLLAEDNAISTEVAVLLLELSALMALLFAWAAKRRLRQI